MEKPKQSFQQSAHAGQILARLFQRHFDDPIPALVRFEKLLSSVELSFDFKSQLRELNLPVQPGLPNPPKYVYYFVPDSRRGTDKVINIKYADPLHQAYLHKADGIGINLGCPVRLFRALEELEKLSSADQKSPREFLKDPREHLTAIEELLWLFGWKSMTKQKRGGQLQGASGDVDWSFEAAGLPVYLEAKFRQSDWMRLTDKESFMMAGDGFLSKATHKFPTGSLNSGLHVVGITFYDSMTEDIVFRIGDELRSAPQIDVVVCRSLIQMFHVISIRQNVRDAIFGILAVPTNKDFPMMLGVMCDRAEQAKRMELRPKQQPARNTSGVLCWPLKPKLVIEPPPIDLDDFYRISISSRKPDGEPIYEVVPRFSM
jgi:hypothetical protein